MYDFVNDWSPLPFGLQHKPHWSSPSKYLKKTWKVFDQSKDCFMSQDLEEENCKCTSHAKTARRRRLRSKSGFYLTVMPNGQVLGVKDPTNSYSKWIIFAFFLQGKEGFINCARFGTEEKYSKHRVQQTKSMEVQYVGS